MLRLSKHSETFFSDLLDKCLHTVNTSKIFARETYGGIRRD